MLPKMRWPLLILTLAAILNNGVTANRVKRLVGGMQVDIEHAPYIVMIRDYRLGDLNAGHTCAGSIISSRHILTAAHCFTHGANDDMDEEEIENLVIVPGHDVYTYAATIYEIDDFFIHPNYRGNFLTAYEDRADIAIIKLAEDIPFNSKQQKIELATDIPPTQAHGVIYGWGSSTRNGPASTHLQGLVLDYFSLPACSYVFPFSAFTADELCGKPRPGTDSCSGDSGGPYVINQQIAGVLSQGSTNCDGSRPTAFASVPYYKSWIEDVINDRVTATYPEPSATSPPEVTYDCSASTPNQSAERFHRFSCQRRRRKKVPSLMNNALPLKYM